MINNIELIIPLLRFDTEDHFYFAQVIRRKKDNPETSGRNNSARLIKAYYITSIERLWSEYDEIVALCGLHNARAGINLNRRSFRRVAFQTLQKISNQMMNEDYKSVRRAYNSVCGEYAKESDKRWIVDIDDKNFDLVNLKAIVNALDPKGNKIVATLPTPNGYHIITTPFNMQQFSSLFRDVDVHKNNPTILYVPDGTTKITT